MTTENIDKSNERELFAGFLLHEDKKLSDRTNIFAVAEPIFFSAFVGLITASNGLPGLFAWFPIIVCGAGIAFSSGWVFYSKYFEITTFGTLAIPMGLKVPKSSYAAFSSAEKARAEATKASDKTGAPEASTNFSYDLFPMIFVIAWTLLLIVYCLHVTKAIAF